MSLSGASKIFWLAILSVLLFSPACTGSESIPQKIVVPEKVFDFGSVDQGEMVQHDFLIRNQGKHKLRLDKVEITGPSTDITMKKEIEPGEDAKVIMILDTKKIIGEEGGKITTTALLHTDDPSNPKIELKLQGEVKPAPIEFKPMKAIFLSAFKGEEKEGSVIILNHNAKPLDIFAIESKSPRFKAELQKVKPGQEYRLVVKPNPDAPRGRSKDLILLFTDNPKHAEIHVPVFLFVKEEVYTFPDLISFGKCDINKIKNSPEFARSLSQTILVKRRPGKGKDFQIKLKSQVPFLAIQKTPESGSETYRLDIALAPQKLEPGKIDSYITVRTNDKDVPELKIPVKGEIL